jgi:hypothetical protein
MPQVYLASGRERLLAFLGLQVIHSNLDHLSHSLTDVLTKFLVPVLWHEALCEQKLARVELLRLLCVRIDLSLDKSRPIQYIRNVVGGPGELLLGCRLRYGISGNL